MFHVKRRSGSPNPAAFHVKQDRPVNDRPVDYGRLLADAKFPEDPIKDVFDIDPTK
jgi:hypothetical protein